VIAAIRLTMRRNPRRRTRSAYTRPACAALIKRLVAHARHDRELALTD
jgi:hypothetical protein